MQSSWIFKCPFKFLHIFGLGHFSFCFIPAFMRKIHLLLDQFCGTWRTAISSWAIPLFNVSLHSRTHSYTPTRSTVHLPLAPLLIGLSTERPYLMISLKLKSWLEILKYTNSWVPLKYVSTLGTGDWRLLRKTYEMCDRKTRHGNSLVHSCHISIVLTMRINGRVITSTIEALSLTLPG